MVPAALESNRFGRALLEKVRPYYRRYKKLRQFLVRHYYCLKRRLLARPERRRLIFLDCGGHQGNSVRKFRSEFDPEGVWEIHSFEPNPSFREHYTNFANHTLHQAAVWTENGTISFFLDDSSGAGSSILRDKTTGGLAYDQPMTVDSIDLDLWIKENVAPDDYVILKMDIEGAEYEVLEKLIGSESIKKVSEIYVEWHWGRIGGMTRKAHDQLLRRLERQILVQDWCALNY